MSLRVLYVDLNSYFASVEQQGCPALRGRPVVVAALDVDSTSCIAVSAEAKRLGIRTGMLVRQAKEICKTVAVIPANPRLYVEYHHRIIRAIDSCVPVNGVHSIDEMSCRLSGRETNRGQAIALADRVRQAIFDQVGACMRCSIGIAPNRMLAKVASDMQKPNGLVILDENELPRALLRLRLSDLPGIGARMLARLNKTGVTSIEQLYALSEQQLRAIWGGVVGQRWWYWLRGHDLPEPASTHRSSVGHSHVLAPELRTMDDARAVLIKLIHKSAARLRQIGYWAQQMSVYLSFTFREEGWNGSVAIGLCQDTSTLIEAFEALWRTRPALDRPTQVAIALYDLVKDCSAEMPLFPDAQRKLHLSHTLDQINAKHGAKALYFGGMHGTTDAAPTRISFNQIPSLSEFDDE